MVYDAETSKSVTYTFATTNIFFFNTDSREERKKIGNTFLAQFTCLTFCLGCYNSTCKSPTSLYEACCYPSLGRHQTLEVATEYFFFGAQVGIEYCTMLR